MRRPWNFEKSLSNFRQVVNHQRDFIRLLHPYHQQLLVNLSDEQIVDVHLLLTDVCLVIGIRDRISFLF
jgi:hypothetical protein